MPTRFKKTLILLIVFVLGMMFDRLVFVSTTNEQPISPTTSSASPRLQNVVASQIVDLEPRPDKIQVTQQQPAPTPIPGPDTKKGHANDLPQIPEIPSDEFLVDLAKGYFSKGSSQLRKENPDGTANARETLADGSTLDSAYSETGLLIGEALKLASGEELVRSFYQEGAVRGVSLAKPNGAITSATFLQTGYLKARVDRLPDGAEISTEYDDRGHVLNRWKRSKDGHTEKL